MHNSFNELATHEQDKATGMANMRLFNPEQTENLDLVSEPNPPQGGNNPPPKIPQWHTNLAGRVGKLETRVGNIETRVGNIETDVAQIKTDVAEIKSSVAKIESALNRQ